jgi:tRNA U38,U39,U40 pseudouridine synthase TruA
MEIYENCLNKPTISCFAERNNSWTLPPDFDYHRAVEVCSMFKGQHNLASFYKVPKKRQSLLLPSEHLTTRDLYLVRITAGLSFYCLL